MQKWIRVRNGWIWVRVVANWWIGFHLNPVAVVFSDVWGRWFLVSLFDPSQWKVGDQEGICTVTLPDGQERRLLNKAGYPFPVVYESKPKDSPKVGAVFIVVVLTPQGPKLLAVNQKRAFGDSFELPRGSFDNPLFQTLLELWQKEFPSIASNTARIAATVGKKGAFPGIGVFAAVVSYDQLPKDIRDAIERGGPYCLVYDWGNLKGQEEVFDGISLAAMMAVLSRSMELPDIITLIIEELEKGNSST